MSNVTHCYHRQTRMPLFRQSLILHNEPQPIHSPNHTSEEIAHETLAVAMLGAAKATSKREERNVKMQHEVCQTSSSPFNGMDKARNSIVRKFTEKLCWQGDQSNGLRVRELTAMRAMAPRSLIATPNGCLGFPIDGTDRSALQASDGKRFVPTNPKLNRPVSSYLLATFI